ncbi:MAG: PocR ligand-binding domain-containing protein [Eubacteriales bacterium]|nr:PocR ligand-binding domain-containing protein [Eubacteriales bacterium]
MNEEISLEDILKDLYTISGIVIVVYDLHGNPLAEYPDKGAHFCNLVAALPDGLLKCQKADRENFETVKKERRFHLYKCHMGLYEAVVPLYHYGTLAGYMMAGQMLEKNPKARAEVFQKARRMKIESDEEINKALDQLVEIDLHSLESFVTMCRVCADYITNHHKFPVPDTHMAKELCAYLDEHYKEQITLEDLCRGMGYGKTRLNQLFQKYTGMSVYHYLMSVRIQKACESLCSPETSIYSVAIRCGFSSQNYFSRQFKKYMGCTPGEYRQRNAMNTEGFRQTINVRDFLL